MADNITIGGVPYQRTMISYCTGADCAVNVSSDNPLPVNIISGGAGGGGGLTDTQLRASAVPVSGTFYPATQPVSGTVSVSGSVAVTGSFYQATQPVSIASMPTTPVTGTFWQATQPVSIASMPSTPVTGTFWQATQPVSGTVTANAGSGTFAVSAPTLTKGTQAANGWSVQNLKDAGRVCVALTAEFAFAQTAETLLTMTKSADGGNTSTGSSLTITSGKKYRIQAITLEVEALGSGTAPQRAYLRLRRNNAGATTASSNLQGVWSCVNNPAVVKTGTVQHFDFPDGIEMNGDGTATFGFTLETPDWVTTTATGRAKITVIGFEY